MGHVFGVGWGGALINVSCLLARIGYRLRHDIFSCTCTHLDTPRRERMKWDEMTSCHVMLHVGKGGLWLSDLAMPEVRKSQVRLQLSSLASSLAIHQWWEGWPPADTLWFRAFHTQQAVGHDFANQKMVLNLVCCFPRCCVVTWNMVLKCLWRCVACSNIKPREVSRRSVQVPRKRPITHTHMMLLYDIFCSSQMKNRNQLRMVDSGTESTKGF